MVTVEVMLIRGVTAVLVGQGLLNHTTNPSYVEPVITPHWANLVKSKFVTTNKPILNFHPY